MRKLFALSVSAVFLTLTSCATGPTIRTDFDPSVNFSTYRTYSWVYTAPPKEIDPVLFERITESVDRSLAARGFTKGRPGEFAVAVTLGRRDRVNMTNWGVYRGAYAGMGRATGPRGWAAGPRGWAPTYSESEMMKVTDGSLAIDIFDTATQRPIWHGVASQQVNPYETPSQAVIDRAVDEVVAKFPPQQ